MDTSEDEVLRIIEEVSEEEAKESNENTIKKRNGMLQSSSSSHSSGQDSDLPLISKLPIETAAVLDIDSAIQDAQRRMWESLKAKSNIEISTEDTQNILKPYTGTKVSFVILHIDLVDSTKLSMTLPVNRLATIVQAFTYEMSLIIAGYGGYVLKYMGDAILAFFVVGPSSNNFASPCVNAVSCASSMIKVIREGIDPILNQYDYAELRVRIGIDVGENAVVQFGWDTHTLDGKVVLKDPHLDILGYTVNIATKMTTLATPDQIVIGQLVYDSLDDTKKSCFQPMDINPEVWNYVSSNTGGDIYRLYSSVKGKRKSHS
jgi:adenylate cyclase